MYEGEINNDHERLPHGFGKMVYSVRVFSGIYMKFNKNNKNII